MKRNLERCKGANLNQNNSLFFFQGDIPAVLKVELDDGSKFDFMLRVEGEKKIYKDNNKIDLDLAIIYSNDEELDKDIQSGLLEIKNNNWFEIIILHNTKEFQTEEVLYSVTELEEYTDQDLINLLKEKKIVQTTEVTKTITYNNVTLKPILKSSKELDVYNICTRHDFCEIISKAGGYNFDLKDFYLNCRLDGISDDYYAFEVMDGFMKGIILIPNQDTFVLYNEQPVEMYFKIRVLDWLYTNDNDFQPYTDKLEESICRFSIFYKRGFLFDMKLNIETLTLTTSFADVILEKKKFDSYYSLHNYLYSLPANSITTENVVERIFQMTVKDRNIKLNELNFDQQYAFTYCIYTSLLSYIVGFDRARSMMKDFADELVTIQSTSFDEFLSMEEYLVAIRTDILNEWQKSLNFKLFTNVDYK